MPVTLNLELLCLRRCFAKCNAPDPPATADSNLGPSSYCDSVFSGDIVYIALVLRIDLRAERGYNLLVAAVPRLEFLSISSEYYAFRERSCLLYTSEVVA